MADSGVGASHGGRSRFLNRLVTVAMQVVSVVFAVLVALGIDEWWEDRENEELGRRGLASIAVEIRTNLRVLENRRPQTDSVLIGIDSALAAFARGATDAAVSIDYPVALLSSAAWQTAQITRAVNFVDIERVIDVAGVYDLQAFFLRHQDRLTDMIADITADVERDPAEIVGRVGRRYRQVIGFRDALANAYRCRLPELEDHAPTEVEQASSCGVDADPRPK